jgi:DNA-binding MarR family transcriptional regulator
VKKARNETIFKSEYDDWRLELNATTTFLTMWSGWVEVMPKSLVGEDPVLLLRLLDLADVRAGISQSDIRSSLKISQSRLSKLTSKLIMHKWLEEVRPQVPDRRFLFVRAGRRGKDAVLALETHLSTLLPTARKSAKPRKLQAPNALGNLLDKL